MPAVLAFIMGVCVMGLAAAVWTNRLHDQLEQERARKTPAGAAVIDAFSRRHTSPVPPPDACGSASGVAAGVASDLEAVVTMYRYAPDVREIAEELIDTLDAHQDLRYELVEYVFVDKAPVSNGRVILGRARKVGGLSAFLLRSARTLDDARFEPPRPFFVIEISYPTWLDLTDAQKRALVDHELCHCKVDMDASPPALWIRGHDHEEFVEIWQRHGLWNTGSQAMGRVLAEQLSLTVDDVTSYVAGQSTPVGE